MWSTVIIFPCFPKGNRAHTLQSVISVSWKFKWVSQAELGMFVLLYNLTILDNASSSALY